MYFIENDIDDAVTTPREQSRLWSNQENGPSSSNLTTSIVSREACVELVSPQHRIEKIVQATNHKAKQPISATYTPSRDR